jgi:antitoxin HicB
MAQSDILKRPYGRLVVREEDGRHRAEILEFPGCIALGDTAAQALETLEEVAESWIESALARGQAIPEPMESNEYSGKLVLRLPRRLHRSAALAAERDGVSLNTCIVTALATYVGEATAKVAASVHLVQGLSLVTFGGPLMVTASGKVPIGTGAVTTMVPPFMAAYGLRGST